MKISKFLIQVFSLSAFIIFTGCVASPYSKFYQENHPVTQQFSNPNNGFIFLAEGEEPNMIASTDITKDIKTMARKRFYPIGSSEFNGEMGSIEAIKDQAKKVKAVAVLYTSKYTNTQTNSGTLLLPQTNYYSGNVNAYNGYGSSYATYNGSSTTTMAVPYSNTQRRYDQSAIFYIKDSKPLKFGFKAIDIQRDKRIEIGRDGLEVTIIFDNTPAYKSNLLEGDIIVEIDGKQVENETKFQNTLKSYDTSKGYCDFKVLRNGVEQNIRVKFL
ncbi:PDZ domain-containing protein [Sulfuricurvum sp.]|uniref:PDZ domain-containing protein n=1 Tax=Sulfuricurvum sp. TaxID=2025608 RepID=UPI00261DE2BE|nr:PDZ domain-containing protein [Sulfuricurvum sp.]MDD2265773.1 PDZ domain-containing protein [Sulfuricurvum sp.]MDD2783101.1 PDZ domain-containing protein [Sulfuricurvum sp.]